MLQEILEYSPRLQWLADTVLKLRINRLLPLIQQAQDQEALPCLALPCLALPCLALPRIEPALLHYLIMSLKSALSTFGAKMLATSKLSASDPRVVATDWNTVEDLIFGARFRQYRP